jgi:hypothetical protein
MEVFKYKPVEKLTIDFLIRRCPPKLLGIAPYLDTEKKLYLLFCGISYHAYNKSGLRLIPQYSELFNNISPSSLPGYFPIQFQSANKTFSYLYWSNEEIDSEIEDRIGELLDDYDYQSSLSIFKKKNIFTGTFPINKKNEPLYIITNKRGEKIRIEDINAGTRLRVIIELTNLIPGFDDKISFNSFKRN